MVSSSTPITIKDIIGMKALLQHVVGSLVAASLPFKQEATFEKLEGDSVKCIVDGSLVRIDKRYIYACAGHLTQGEKFMLDNRYI